MRPGTVPEKPSYDTVLTLSGGMDSTVLLYHLLHEKRRVATLSVDYGQRHKREITHAQQIASFAPTHVPHTVVRVPDLRAVLAGSSQTSPEIPVPHGHYAAETMKQTVVPNRNMILLAIAAGYAISLGAERVAYAAHAGDHTIYPDCRPDFASALDAALALCDWKPPRLLRPFATWTKAEIAARGHVLGVPFHRTWSCYEGQDLHCGLCGTCVERREAFSEAAVPDPTEYRETPT